MSIHRIGAASALCFCAVSAQANTLTLSQSASFGSLDFFEAAFSIDQFNPNLGDLTRVDLSLETRVTIDAGIENEGPTPTDAELVLASNVFAFADGAAGLNIEATPSESISFDLAGYDGVTDFDGPSGASVAGEAITVIAQNSFTDPDILEAATGTGMLDFIIDSFSQVTGQSLARFADDPAVSFVGETDVDLSVVYSFDAADVIAPVPLPASVALLGVALAGMTIAARRRR